MRTKYWQGLTSLLHNGKLAIHFKSLGNIVSKTYENKWNIWGVCQLTTSNSSLVILKNNKNSIAEIEAKNGFFGLSTSCIPEASTKKNQMEHMHNVNNNWLRWEAPRYQPIIVMFFYVSCVCFLWMNCFRLCEFYSPKLWGETNHFVFFFSIKSNLGLFLFFWLKL